MQGIDFVYLNNVKEHLIQNGKEPSFRVWKGINIRDPLDEEWEQFLLLMVSTHSSSFVQLGPHGL
jgi:hypothetical protein